SLRQLGSATPGGARPIESPTRSSAGVRGATTPAPGAKGATKRDAWTGVAGPLSPESDASDSAVAAATGGAPARAPSPAAGGKRSAQAPRTIGPAQERVVAWVGAAGAVFLLLWTGFVWSASRVRRTAHGAPGAGGEVRTANGNGRPRSVMVDGHRFEERARPASAETRRRSRFR